MNFASDNAAGIAPEILAAIARANEGAALGYGETPGPGASNERFAEMFEREVAVFLVPTGTAANALALAHLTPPWGAVLCHERVAYRDGRMRRAGILRRRHQARRACPAKPARSRRDTLQQRAPDVVGRSASRQSDGALALAGDRSRHDLSAGRDPRTRRHRPCAWHGRARRRRAPRQRARAHECLAGAGDLEGGRRCAIVRRDQRRRDGGRSRDIFRSRAGRTTCRSGASAAAISSPSTASSPRKWRPICADGLWLKLARHANAMADRLAAGLAAAGVLRCGRSRPTRCSSRCRAPRRAAQGRRRELLPVDDEVAAEGRRARARCDCSCVSSRPLPPPRGGGSLRGTRLRAVMSRRAQAAPYCRLCVAESRRTIAIAWCAVAKGGTGIGGRVVKHRVLLCAASPLALLASRPALAQPVPPATRRLLSGRSLPPHEVVAIVSSTGLEPVGRPVRQGPVYTLRAVDPAGEEVRSSSMPSGGPRRQSDPVDRPRCAMARRRNAAPVPRRHGHGRRPDSGCDRHRADRPRSPRRDRRPVSTRVPRRPARRSTGQSGPPLPRPRPKSRISRERRSAPQTRCRQTTSSARERHVDGRAADERARLAPPAGRRRRRVTPKRKRPGNRGAPFIGFNSPRPLRPPLASTACGWPLPIGIWRGFFASGISRTRSTCRRPFSSAAPLTWT